MLEIKCSKQQKKLIIQSLKNPDGCLWPRKRPNCAYDKDSDCNRCFEEKIRWIH